MNNELYGKSDFKTIDLELNLFGEDEYDVVLFKSVFTHLPIEDIRRYLHIAFRALKLGGRVVATFILFEKNQSPKDLSRHISFTEYETNTWVMSLAHPMALVAYEWNFIKELATVAGFELREAHYGNWRGSGGGMTAQDLLILQKPT